jgi:hypothetical protein
MKLIMILTLLTILSLPLVLAADDDLRIKRMAVLDEVVNPYDGMLLWLQLENNFGPDIEDVTITISLLEIEVRKKIFVDEIDSDDTLSRLYYLGIPNDTPPGEYTVRVVVQNEDYRIVKHRYIYVI